MLRVSFALVVVLAFLSFASGQTTWYVDDDAGPGGDGTTWNTPYNNLQSALAAAGGNDVIHVAGGTYVPSSPTDPSDARSATFSLFGSVGLYGGYAGLADPNNPDQRHIASYETILTGDLAGNDGPNFSNNDENSYHVVSADGAGLTATLDGFTITAGNANAAEYPHRDGGGMIVDNGATPTIASCRFLQNTAYMGGGLFNYNTDPTVVSCSFEGNVAEWGGGVNNSTSSATFTDCSFTGNAATGADSGDGGGLRNITDASPTLIRCMFTDNHADLSGGGVINRETCSPTLRECTFSGNTAGTAGGGMGSYTSSSPIVVNCIFSGNTADTHGAGVINRESSNGTFTNCLFIGNNALINGGAMLNRVSSGPTVVNSTFSGNTAAAGGAMFNATSVPTAANCILWGDTPDEIGGDSSPLITYSDVQGGFTGTGNMNQDPDFGGAGNYRLSAGSLCIDAGNNLAVPADASDLDDDADVAERTPLDLDLNARFVNDAGTADTGVADPPNYPDVVDMGAYEFGAFCPGDLDGDNDVDLADLAQLLGNYGATSGAVYEDGDLDGDGDVDLADLAGLLGLYGTTCP